MKTKLPWIIVGILALWLVAGLRPATEKSEFNITKFGETPVLLEGRIKPIDTMARNALLIISGKQKVVLEGNGANGQWGDFLELSEDPSATPLSGRNWYQFSKHPKKLTAMEWLLEVTMKPETANDRYIFRMDHPELIVDLGLEGKGYEKAGFHWYTFNELRDTPGLFETLQSERDRLEENQVEPENYTPQEKQTVKLYSSLQLYNRLKNSFRPEISDDFVAELDTYFSLIPKGMEAARNREAGRPYDEEAFESLMGFIGNSGYDTVASIAYPLIIPPSDPSVSRDEWTNLGDELINALRTETVPEIVRDYAEIASAYRQNRPEDFNTAVDSLQETLSASYSEELEKGEMEKAYNHYNPFLKSQILYVLATLFALVFWLKLDEKYRRTAVYLMLLALVVHSAGIITRMVLEGRPPVTNLYSSAIFVGWGAVFFCILLEYIFKNGIGIVVAAMVGFTTLMIGHYLSLSGDTLVMMRAVLDTNAWLATHVVIITLGYSATFVAGFIAIIYVVRGVFSKTLTPELGKSLSKMVYGIVCFATLLSFVGTILGGIWADQSWGRFWGWDPKENGALIIVIWNAAILHARWGGIIRDRGLMLMAVFGNIATAFSWFGVNLLGVGLHSYGFMDGSFEWLTKFIASQVAIILIGLLIPQRYWLSFQKKLTSPPPPPRGLPKEASA